MNLFSRRATGQVNVYRDVLFDQSLSMLKPIAGEDVVMDTVGQQARSCIDYKLNSLSL
jgi:hypothetical protein